MDLKIRGLGHDITFTNIDINTTNLASIQSQIESQTNLPYFYQRILCNGKTLYPPKKLKARTSNSSSSSSPDVAVDSCSDVGTDETDDETRVRKSTLQDLFTKLKIRHSGRNGSVNSSSSSSSNPIIKMILMHNASYSKDRVHIESMNKLSDEIQTYETKYKELTQQQQQQHVDENTINNDNANNNDVAQETNKTKYRPMTMSIDSPVIHQDEMKIIQHRIIEISCQLDAVDVSSSTSLRQMRKSVLKRLDDLERNINSLL